ncbi:MAG: DNA primase [Dehalococcoidales bacterium]|nr:DNA primase [Dehalococcoidales bacterium]
MSVIDEVKQRTDIIEVISQYTALKKTGRTYRALCPFHSEKSPSFYVYPEQQSWHCFGACNTGGDVLSFIMKKEGMEFGEALRLLAQKAGVSIPSRTEPKAKENEREKIYQINQVAVEYFHNLLLNSPAAEQTRKYITSRGLLPKTVVDFQLGFSLNKWDALKQYFGERGYSDNELLVAGLVIESEDGGIHDRFRNRLMFPIYNNRGQIVGFGARVLDDTMPKYLNSPQTIVFEKSGCLYGINLAAAAIRQKDSMVIVEGYMDVITAHQNGFNNVVASMGTAVTERQIDILKRLSKNVVFALDADEAGEEAMLRSVSYENNLNAEVKIAVLPKGKDPDNVIKEDIKIWQKLLEESLPVLDYTFNMSIPQFNINTARGKSLLVDKLLPVINEMKDIVRRTHYMQKLARLAGISLYDLEVILGKKKLNHSKYDSTKSEPPVVAQVQYPLSNKLEEYCLALVLQHPELKDRNEALVPEYFENAENREILALWQYTNDLSLLEDGLDSVVWEYLNSLVLKNIPGDQLEKRYANCVLRLREKYLRSLEVKKAEVLASEAEAGGTAAEIAKLREQGIEVSVQLGEIFNRMHKDNRE